MASNLTNDAPVLSDLLAQLPSNEALKSLLGDETYDTQPAYEAVVRHGAIHIIPLRKNVRARKEAGSKHLEALDWLPPAKLGGSKDELH